MCRLQIPFDSACESGLLQFAQQLTVGGKSDLAILRQIGESRG
ncbi:MAG: hypothetical protein R3C26_17595 [Calditrichia bacterium]